MNRGYLQGSIAPVLHCLSTLQSSFDLSAGDEDTQIYSRKKWNLHEVESLDGINNFSGLRFQDFQNGSVISGMVTRPLGEFKLCKDFIQNTL